MEAKESISGISSQNLQSKKGNSPEAKWAARLFIAMMACMISTCIIHAVGEVAMITHICA